MTYWHRNLLQAATYWPPVEHASGGVSYGSPTARTCRWEDGEERVASVDGKEIRFRSIVTLDTDVERDGKLYLGTSAASTPPAAARVIQAVERAPRLRTPAQKEITAYL